MLSRRGRQRSNSGIAVTLQQRKDAPSKKGQHVGTGPTTVDDVARSNDEMGEVGASHAALRAFRVTRKHIGSGAAPVTCRKGHRPCGCARDRWRCGPSHLTPLEGVVDADGER